MIPSIGNYNTWLKRSYVPVWGFPMCNVSNPQQLWGSFCCDNHKRGSEGPMKSDKETKREGEREREKKNKRMSQMNDTERERER